MSREAIATCRTALEMIAEVSKEATVKALAARALGSLTELAVREDQRRKRETERKRSWRGGRPPDVPGTGDGIGPRDVPGTSAGLTRTDVGGGLGGDPSGDPGGSREISKTPTVGDPGEGPRDVPGTSAGPAIVQGSMLVDAWLEGMREATGQPSWIRLSIPLGNIRTLQAVLETTAPKDATGCAWARAAAKEYVGAHPDSRLTVFGYQTWEQSGRRRSGKPEEEDPQAKLRHDRERNRAADAKVEAAARAAQPADDEARARAADAEQAKRARAATTRASSVPTTLGGAKPPRREMTDQEREQERQRQLAELAALERKGATG